MFSQSNFNVHNPAGAALSAERRGFYNFQVAVVNKALDNATRRQELGSYTAREIAQQLSRCADAESLERSGSALLGAFYTEAKAALISSLPDYLRRV